MPNDRVSFVCPKCGHRLCIDLQRWTQEKIDQVHCPNCEEKIFLESLGPQILANLAKLPHELVNALEEWHKLITEIPLRQLRITVHLLEPPYGVTWSKPERQDPI